MGFGISSDDDESTEQNDPSGTHIYFYEQGHERLPDDEEVSSVLAEAYENAKTQPSSGRVRGQADAGWSGGLQHMLAEFVNKVDELIETGSPLPIIEWVMEDYSTEDEAEALAQYLDENPEVGREIIERLETTEATAEAEADD